MIIIIKTCSIEATCSQIERYNYIGYTYSCLPTPLHADLSPKHDLKRTISVYRTFLTNLGQISMYVICHGDYVHVLILRKFVLLLLYSLLVLLQSVFPVCKDKFPEP